VPQRDAADQEEHTGASKYERFMLAQPYELRNRTHKPCQSGARAESNEDRR
jgi:hypothetical protein